MVYRSAKYVIASLLLLLVSACSIFGNNEEVEDVYSQPNQITRFSIDDGVLEYTWIKYDSCVNSHLVLDHELKEGSVKNKILIVNVKLISKQQGPVKICFMMYYGEQNERIDLLAKLQEIAKQYGYDLENSRNDCSYVLSPKCVSIELNLPTVKLMTE